jgi:hypothetical protein
MQWLGGYSRSTTLCTLLKGWMVPSLPLRRTASYPATVRWVNSQYKVKGTKFVSVELPPEAAAATERFGGAYPVTLRWYVRSTP